MLQSPTVGGDRGMVRGKPQQRKPAGRTANTEAEGPGSPRTG